MHPAPKVRPDGIYPLPHKCPWQRVKKDPYETRRRSTDRHRAASRGTILRLIITTWMVWSQRSLLDPIGTWTILHPAGQARCR